jgi:uncharacterized membrane protein
MNKKLFILILLSIILTLPNLFDKERGTDEKLSINNANSFKDLSSFGDLYKTLGVEVNPPLFFILLSIPLRIIDSLITLKIIIILFALLSVITFYLVAKELFSKNFALVATFLYIINPMHIVFSQHIRAYIFLFSLFNLAIFFNYRFIFKKDQKALYFIGIIYIIGVYTHYYAGLFILGFGITTLILKYLKKNKINIKNYIITNIIVGIFSIPALLLLKLQSNRLYEDLSLGLIQPKEIFYPLYKMAFMIDISTITKFSPLILIIPAIICLVFIYGIFLLYKKEDSKGIFIISIFGVPYIILSIMGLFWPTHSFRYLTFLLTPLVIILTYSLENIQNKKLRTILIMIIITSWLLANFYYFSISPIYHWPELIAI